MVMTMRVVVMSVIMMRVPVIVLVIAAAAGCRRSRRGLRAVAAAAGRRGDRNGLRSGVVVLAATCAVGFAAGLGVCRHDRSVLDLYTLWGYISGMRTEIKASVAKRLNRIEGQVRGLSRMVEDDRYCIDIVTQISAVRAALRRVEEEVLRDHVGHCVEHAIASGDKRDQRQKISELIDVLSRANR
jgi:DNA-binding FrmR family transcriptional regulator